MAVAAREEGDRVVVEVTGSGAGISRGSHGEGMGLGLAIARRIGNLLNLQIGERSIAGEGGVVLVGIWRFGGFVGAAIE